MWDYALVGRELYLFFDPQPVPLRYIFISKNYKHNLTHFLKLSIVPLWKMVRVQFFRIFQEKIEKNKMQKSIFD